MAFPSLCQPTSVNGRVGKVILNYADVGAAPINDPRLSDQRTPLDASVTNAKVATAAGIVRSKLDFGAGLVNSDVATAAGVARSKLDFGSGLVNSDIAAGAAIVYSKLSLTSSIVHGDIATANKDGLATVPSMRTLGTSTPPMDGSGSPGVSLSAAPADHQHPTDSSRASTASPTFTGTVTIPTLRLTTLQDASGIARAAYAPAANVGVRLSSDAIATVPLQVRGFASQTGDLQEWQDSTGANKALVKSDGWLRVPGIEKIDGSQAYLNYSTTEPTFVARTGTGIALAIQGATSQSAALQVWRDSSSSTLASIEAAGTSRTNLAAATAILRNFLLVADTNPSFRIFGSGKQEWGPGGATAVDANLYRSAVGVIRTDTAFGVDGGGTGSKLLFGSAGDATLYRSAAAIVKTDGTFNAVTGYQLNGTALASSHLSDASSLLKATGFVSLDRYPRIGGETDDTNRLARAVADGVASFPNGFILLLPYSALSVASFPDLHGKQGISWRGVGGRSGGAGTATTIIFTGTGTRAIDFRQTVGCGLIDLDVQYTNAAFTGTLVDFRGLSGAGPITSFGFITRCTLTGTGSGAVSGANELVALANNIGFVADQVLLSGAVCGVRGRDSSADFCNGNELRSVHTGGTAQAPIQDFGGEGNTIINPIAEPLADGSAGWLKESSALGGARNLNVYGGWWGDATRVGSWVDWVGSGLAMHGGTMYRGDIQIKLGANSSNVSIKEMTLDDTNTIFNLGTNCTHLDLWPNSIGASVTNVLTYATGAKTPLNSDLPDSSGNRSSRMQGGLAVGGSYAPTRGQAVEFGVTSSTGFIQVQDRDASTTLPFNISGNPVSLYHAGSTQVLKTAATGVNVLGSLLFDAAADTNLYRAAAASLKTDGTMSAASGYRIGAALTGAAYQSQQVAAQTVLQNLLVGTDANPSVRILGDGKIQWGPGGATAVDTDLFRVGAGALKTTSSLVVTGSAAPPNGSGPGLEMGTVSGVAYFQASDRQAGGSVSIPLHLSGSEVSMYYGGTLRIRVDSNGLAFFDKAATPIAKPTVTGSRGGNAALASLLTALANLGLVLDSSTA